jgi:hypothetical protein
MFTSCASSGLTWSISSSDNGSLCAIQWDIVRDRRGDGSFSCVDVGLVRDGVIQDATQLHRDERFALAGPGLHTSKGQQGSRTATKGEAGTAPEQVILE